MAYERPNGNHSPFCRNPRGGSVLTITNQKRIAHFYRLETYFLLLPIKNCRQLGVAYERPNDYYAEMVKTDEHMLKVLALNNPSPEALFLNAYFQHPKA